MKTYFDKLFEEKGIDLETKIEMEEQIGFTVKNVIEFLNNAPKNIKDKAMRTYTMIDFKNGDIMDFTKHLAKGIIDMDGTVSI